MKTSIRLLSTFLFLLCLSSNAQTIRIRTGSINKETKLVTPVSKEEFVLYRNIIRKYTWYEGVGKPITQETANHLPFYFKLSMKNPQGHWQLIEAMHQGEKTTHHDQSTYILDRQNDQTEQSQEWIEKLNSVAQWYMIADLDGNEVVEERAYTVEGDLIYSFVPIKNPDGRIRGSYNDAWGLPVDMSPDSETTYGDVVCITYDEIGRDYIIDYLDGNGLRKYNSNGVDQQRYRYDEEDRILMLTSHNLVGDYSIDNWGNCGNRYEYFDSGYIITRIDKDLKPMRMPKGRADDTQTFIRCVVKRDTWGRDSEATMYDENGNPDTTSSGIHQIRYIYDEDGNLLSTDYYDINNQKMN